jgi:hypothetical protein
MRIALAAAALAAVLAGVAGCAGGSGGTTAGSAAPATGPAASSPATSDPSGAASSTQSGPSSTGTSGSGPTRCHTSDLAASLAPGEPGAGQRYATLSLTNTSTRTCTVFGYGGLQPLDAAKKQLPITPTRDTGRAVTLIRLAPRTSVGRTIHWSAVPSGSQPCPTPAYASIIPPDETSPLVIGWSLGPVCGDKMDGWPYGVTL